jgi:tetratricopeptide (TPR) repeat protein
LEIDTAYSINEIDEAHAALSRASALVGERKINQAISDLNRLVSRYPLYLSAHRLLAKIYLQSGNLPAAYLHLAYASSGDPDDGFASVNLEAAAFELGFLESAASQFQSLEAAISRPDERAVHFFNKGKILNRRNDYVGSIEAYRTCLAANPKHPEAPVRMIDSMHAEGMASEAFETALSLLRSTKEPSFELLSVAADFSDEALRELVPLIEPHLDAVECRDQNARIAHDFLRAKLSHAKGEYEDAWRFAMAANLEKRGQVAAERERDAQWEKSILEWSRGGHIPSSSGLSPNASVPLFLLGPSRSGKTTLESLLSRIEGVRRGFENKLLSSAVAKANNAGGMLPSGFLPFLPDRLLPKFSEIYHRLVESKSAGSKVFTTTTPGLVAYVPSIIAALPTAKFILMHRSPLDLLVRTYFKNYRSGHHHAYDPKWIAEYVDWYDDLSRQWEKQFPERVRILSYEQLVANPTKTVSDIAMWLGLNPQSLEGPLVGDDSGVAKPYISIMKKEGAIAPSQHFGKP